MAYLKKTETTASGLKYYVYACDACGADTVRYHARDNQVKYCTACTKKRDRATAERRKKEIETRHKSDALYKFAKWMQEHKNIDITPLLAEYAEENKC